MVLREGGNMAVKLFDVFTPFIHDLLYLVASCFEKVSLLDQNLIEEWNRFIAKISISICGAFGWGVLCHATYDGIV
jgi:hypothetical protein